MKIISKIALLVALLNTSMNAFALQCPPPSALQHVSIGQQWKLNTAYKNDFIVLESQARWSNLKTMDGNLPLSVYLVSYPGKNWRATCSYNTARNSNHRQVKLMSLHEVLLAKAKMPMNLLFKPASPITQNMHVCSTIADEPDKCVWF